MSLTENIEKVRKNIEKVAKEAGRDPNSVILVAATKTQTSETIRAAIAAGVTICGENRVQELVTHLDENAYEGAEIHFIGHLQTNKVRFVVGRVDLIQSVDSPRLLEAIEKQAAKLDLVQDILIEVNIGGEASKGGCPVEDVSTLARMTEKCPHVRLRGLMAIPPVAYAPGDNLKFFQKTFQLFVDIRTEMGDNGANLTYLSMGMSGDYPDAIRAGATHVRVGTALFGPRPPMGKTAETKESET